MLNRQGVVLVEDAFKLLFLLTVLIDLFLQLRNQFLHGFLESLDFRLFLKELLSLLVISLVTLDFRSLHLVDLLSKLLQLRFVKRHLLAAISLLLLEFDSLRSWLHLATSELELA